MAYTQTNQNSTFSTAFTDTITTTLTANAGDFIYVLVQGGDTGSLVLSTVADSQSQSYTKKLSVVDTFNNRRTTQAYFKNSAALSGATITATFSSQFSGNKFIYAASWGGCDTAVGFDVEAGQFQSGSGTSTDGTTSTAATTTQADLILGGAYDSTRGSATAVAAGTGFTMDLNNTIGNGDTYSVEHLSQGASGSVAATFTAANNDQISTLMMAVRPAAADTLMPQIAM